MKVKNAVGGTVSIMPQKYFKNPFLKKNCYRKWRNISSITGFHFLHFSSRLKKSKTWVRFFWSRFSQPNHKHNPPSSITIIARPSMGDENRAKKIENSFDFFGRVFHPPCPLPSQDLRIRNIESSSNIFGNLLTISNSRVPRLVSINSEENLTQLLRKLH